MAGRGRRSRRSSTTSSARQEGARQPVCDVFKLIVSVRRGFRVQPAGGVGALFHDRTDDGGSAELLRNDRVTCASLSCVTRLAGVRAVAGPVEPSIISGIQATVLLFIDCGAHVDCIRHRMERPLPQAQGRPRGRRAETRCQPRVDRRSVAERAQGLVHELNWPQVEFHESSHIVGHTH